MIAETDQLRDMIQALVREFEGCHYDGCLANEGGSCSCMAGLLVASAAELVDMRTRADLRRQQEADNNTP